MVAASDSTGVHTAVAAAVVAPIFPVTRPTPTVTGRVADLTVSVSLGKTRYEIPIDGLRGIEKHPLTKSLTVAF